MLNFKTWLEDVSEYDTPDEALMQKVLETPISVKNRNDFTGEIFLFIFPIKKEEIKIKFGGKIKENAAKGSLTAVCLKMLKSRSYKELYDLLLNIKHNEALKKQIIYHKRLA